jgi:hypothetical protein
MTEDTRPDSSPDPTPVPVTGAIRVAAAVIIALLALGITALAVHWLPGAVAAWPWSQ